MDKLSRIKELIEILNKAAKAYYQSDEEIMSMIICMMNYQS